MWPLSATVGHSRSWVAVKKLYASYPPLYCARWGGAHVVMCREPRPSSAPAAAKSHWVLVGRGCRAKSSAAEWPARDLLPSRGSLMACGAPSRSLFSNHTPWHNRHPPSPKQTAARGRSRFLRCYLSEERAFLLPAAHRERLVRCASTRESCPLRRNQPSANINERIRFWRAYKGVSCPNQRHAGT